MTLDPRPRSSPEAEGGDPACWLDRVCPQCGRFAEDDSPSTCRGCGARLTWHDEDG